MRHIIHVLPRGRVSLYPGLQHGYEARGRGAHMDGIRCLRETDLICMTPVRAEGCGSWGRRGVARDPVEGFSRRY